MGGSLALSPPFVFGFSSSLDRYHPLRALLAVTRTLVVSPLLHHSVCWRCSCLYLSVQGEQVPAHSRCHPESRLRRCQSGIWLCLSAYSPLQQSALRRPLARLRHRL